MTTMHLSELKRVHELASKRYPHEYLDVGLGAVGLFLNTPPRNFGYAATPQNSITFAHLGVDGIHVGVLTANDTIDPESPVVLTIPMAFEQQNFIVGENLHDFLSLGCRGGFAHLANLHLLLDDTLAYYQNPEYEVFDERFPAILALMTDELQLRPWLDVRAHFCDLQESFAARIQTAHQ